MNSTDFSPRQIEIMETAISLIDTKGIQELTIKNLSHDVGVTEAALYRHFGSKDEILHGLLMYALETMSENIKKIVNQDYDKQLLKLEDILNIQMEFFNQKPAIASVIFAEGIFQFNGKLSSTVALMMELMHKHISDIIKVGQRDGTIRNDVSEKIITYIIMGSMRITVLRWKLSGHKTNLIDTGKTVLKGIIKMIET